MPQQAKPRNPDRPQIQGGLLLARLGAVSLLRKTPGQAVAKQARLVLEIVAKPSQAVSLTCQAARAEQQTQQQRTHRRRPADLLNHVKRGAPTGLDWAESGLRTSRAASAQHVRSSLKLEEASSTVMLTWLRARAGRGRGFTGKEFIKENISVLLVKATATPFTSKAVNGNHVFSQT